MFPQINSRQSFPALEEEILAYWDTHKTFQKSLDLRKGGEEFSFYDGPPFATGMPHYGHLLGGALKDAIPRYQTMRGKYVERRFGWDCHGLPIENIVEKRLGIAGKQDIEDKIGIHDFNEECRKDVFKFASDWRRVVSRIGRWVDMDHDYKTMDPDFMESVWWVFGQLYKKGLIYERERVVPYCPHDATPLSNFEVNQGYEMKQDKAVTVKFVLRDRPGVSILAWTTTPWTLPANLGLAVGEGIEYAEILDHSNGERYIIAKDRLTAYYKDESTYTIEHIHLGKDLVDLAYGPLYSDWTELLDMPKGMELGERAYRVVLGHHVTTDSGTGVVHIAPAYGEDDNEIGRVEQLGYVSHIGSIGRVEHIRESFRGVWVFDFNDHILKDLKERGLLVQISTIDHSYPHCYRCKTPLIYRGISAWYVDVESIREKMLKNNAQTNWTPDHIRDGRFGKWLEGARDWNISRNRYWGSAIPVWKTADGSKQICISSREDLYVHSRSHRSMTKVIFVRHGRTDYNEVGLQDSLDKARLSDLGREQASALIDHLSGEEITAIYSSPFVRCHETIAPLSEVRGLEIRSDVRLQECQKPSWQDKKVPCMKSWSEYEEGDEKIEEVYARVGHALDDIIARHPGETVVIVSHGDPVMLGMMYLDQKQGDDYTIYKQTQYPQNKEGVDMMIKTRYVLQKTKRSVDIHKHYMDELVLTHPETHEDMRRVSEVLDCWFESGSMPYAQKHYPFEEKARFESTFPADFIAEGLDQTRGWFYTLMVLSTALFDKEPFKNVIVNGLILAEDGKKMSKSLKNYPDPEDILSRHGADALRYYLLSSQVTRAEDLRFSEAGVEEVVKSVILPLWNTYSFFTTYANIDGYAPSNAGVTLMRHAQSEANATGRVSDMGANVSLTDLGRQQALETAKRFKLAGRKFDRIIVTSAIRTQETAEIIRDYLGLSHIQIEQRDALVERSAGEFSALTLAQMQAIDPSVTAQNYFQKALAYGAESYEVFGERVLSEMESLHESAYHSNQSILIVAHGGTGRVVGDVYFGRSSDHPLRLSNAESIDLPRSPLRNPLDIWMESRLMTVVAEVTDALDTYALSRATLSITTLIDDVTNFFVRRSRKRFWGSEMTDDKLSAYETLYRTLSVISQLLAPIAPFVSEAIYRGLHDGESVHLSHWPAFDRHRVSLELNSQIEAVRRIIRLGLSLRAQKKIRVRQPLSLVQVSRDLDILAQEVIKEELNVKVLEVIDPKMIAREILKVDARKLGPKFGKSIQEIIQAGKRGEFEKGDNGFVMIVGHELFSDEYEVVYEPYDMTRDVAGEAGIVIALDTVLTPDLIDEGYARDLIRSIQDMRKEQDYHVMDRLILDISSSSEMMRVLDSYGVLIAGETLSEMGKVTHADIERSLDIDGYVVVIRLQKTA